MNLKYILDLGNIDHYAVVIYDIEKSCNFHVNFLGFSITKSYKIKTSMDSDKEDSLSIVLEKSVGNNKEMCVLNMPLNDKSFLNPYLKKYGEGIHHVAYSVKDIEAEFQKGLRNKIIFTTENIIYDHRNSLKQVFIDKSYTGYFIELVQREENAIKEFSTSFSEDNIKELMIAAAKNL